MSTPVPWPSSNDLTVARSDRSDSRAGLAAKPDWLQAVSVPASCGTSMSRHPRTGVTMWGEEASDLWGQLEWEEDDRELESSRGSGNLPRAMRGRWTERRISRSGRPVSTQAKRRLPARSWRSPS